MASGDTMHSTIRHSSSLWTCALPNSHPNWNRIRYSSMVFEVALGYHDISSLSQTVPSHSNKR